MKKVLLSLLAVAALVLSCQNYDDEFDALNAKVSSLESQISSLQGLQTALTSVQSSVSALQSAVNAIPNPSASIAALATSIAKILTDLGALQAAAATSTDLDALKTELSSTLDALKALIEANSTSIASLVLSNADLKTQLEGLGVDVDAVLAANATFDGNLKITNDGELLFAKSLGNKVKSIRGTLEVLVEEDGLDPVEVNKVLSQIEFVVGDVKITTDASLDLSALTVISGDYTVIGHNVSDDALTSVGDDVWLNYDGEISFSSLTSADHIFIVGKAADEDAEPVALVGTTKINLLSLNKASGVSVLNSNHTSGGGHTSGSSLSVSGLPLNSLYLPDETTEVIIGQAPVVLVSGDELTKLELHYAADYEEDDNEDGSAALARLSITAPELSSATVMARTINGNVSVEVTASDATDATATVNFAKLVSAGGIDSDALTTSFSSIKTIGTGGIALEFDETVSLPELTVSVGAIVLDEATSFSAANLTRVGSSIATVAGSAITANEVTGAVVFDKLTKAGAVTMEKVTSFSAKNAKVSSINIEEGSATKDVTVILGSVSSTATTPSSTPLATYFPDASAITVLELHNQDADVDLTAFTLATDITIKGKANAAGMSVVSPNISSANAKLESLVLGGALNNVSVTTGTTTKAQLTAKATALTSIKTEGTIISFTVNEVFSLASIDMGHSADPNAMTPPIVVVTNNHSLGSLKTSVESIRTLTVTGNGKLSDLNFTSLTKVPNNFVVNDNPKGIVNINISDNYTDKGDQVAVDRGYVTAAQRTAILALAQPDIHSSWVGLKGTYSAVTNSQDEVYGQPGLATLKPFIAAVKSAHTSSTGVLSSSPNTRVSITLNYIAAAAAPTAASTVKTLTGDSAADYASYANLQ